MLSLCSRIKCLLETRSTPVGSHPYCIILVNDEFSCWSPPSCSETVGWVTWSFEPMEWNSPSSKLVSGHAMLGFICYKWANSFLTYTNSVEPCSPFIVQEHAVAQEVFPCLGHFRRLRFGQGFGEGYDFASRSVKCSEFLWVVGWSLE